MEGEANFIKQVETYLSSKEKELLVIKELKYLLSIHKIERQQNIIALMINKMDEIEKLEPLSEIKNELKSSRIMK